MDGSFQLKSLIAGSYVVCAQVPLALSATPLSDQFIDSCGWQDASVVRISLAEAQARTGVAITMKRGRLLAIRVNDPGKLLPKVVGQPSGKELSLRMAGPSALVRRIPIIGEDAGGRTYGIVIPYDAAHKLWIDSSNFALNDENGHGYSGSTALDIRVSRGDPPQTYVVNVGKGAKP